MKTKKYTFAFVLLGSTFTLVVGCSSVSSSENNISVSKQNTSSTSNDLSNSSIIKNQSPASPVVLTSDDSPHIGSSGLGWDIHSSSGTEWHGTSILRTTDHGQKWVPLPASLVSSKGSKTTFSGAHIISGQSMIFAASSGSKTVTYLTSDGGNHWTKSILPHSFLDTRYCFINNSDGWLLASPGPGAGSENVYIYQTTNGGQSWNEIYTTNQHAGIPVTGIKTSITFVGKRTGFITNENGTEKGNVGLFITHNGGQTWTPVKIALPAKFQSHYLIPQHPMFNIQGTGILPVQVEGIGTAIYRTNNKGISWSLQSVIPLKKVVDAGFTNSNDLWITDGKAVYHWY